MRTFQGGNRDRSRCGSGGTGGSPRCRSRFSSTGSAQGTVQAPSIRLRHSIDSEAPGASATSASAVDVEVRQAEEVFDRRAVVGQRSVPARRRPRVPQGRRRTSPAAVEGLGAEVVQSLRARPDREASSRSRRAERRSGWVVPTSSDPPAQAVVYGKTLRKVRAMILYSASVPATHCTAMPPRFNTRRRSWKYSPRYRFPQIRRRSEYDHVRRDHVVAPLRHIRKLRP